MGQTFPKISIILLNWNGKQDTLECLASLAEIDYPNVQLIVVDNGSSDESVKVIRAAYPTLPILETGENLGFAGGNNIGIEWALRHHAEWILLLNNDTVVDPQLLKAFLAAAREQPKAKILGAKILRYQDPTTIDHLGGFWNAHKGEFFSPEAGHPDHPYSNMQRVDYVCAAAMFLHRSVPETIGLLEPKFFLFWEESDYAARALRAGLQIWTAPEAKVWHKVSSSFTGGKPHTHYFWWRSRLLWVERNCTPEEKRRLYHTIIFPQLWKMGKHYLLKSLFSTDREKVRCYRAGCRGAWDYFRGRFGNCPDWVLKKRSKL